MGICEQVSLAAMASNIRKGAKFLTEYGLPEPCIAR